MIRRYRPSSRLGLPSLSTAATAGTWAVRVRMTATSTTPSTNVPSTECDVVKVMVTGGVHTPTYPMWASQFDLEQLRLIVDTAHTAGMPVAAHLPWH